MTKLIPWAQPRLFGDEAEAMQNALSSTWISGGPYVDQFETLISGFVSARFACATSNGTTALHLAYLALGIGPGDDVIVPGFGYLGAANIALLCGARPVFAEVDANTWCLTAEAVGAVLTGRTKAVVAVHTYGNMCDIGGLTELLSPRKISLIEDAAEAFGSSRAGKQAGAAGTVGTYSFHATKTITTGEGGMVVTNDPNLAQKMQLFRSHGMARSVRYYWHQVPGHNFRLTNFQAAMGCAQFAHLNEIIETRNALHQQYRERLQSVAGVTLQEFESATTPVLWAMSARLDPSAFPQGRDRVIEQMRLHGIECRPGFYAASQQPLYEAPPLKVCEDLAQQVISLPCYVGLEEEQVNYICDCLLQMRVPASPIRGCAATYDHAVS